MFCQPQGLGHSELEVGFDSELRVIWLLGQTQASFSQRPPTVTSPQPARGSKPSWILLLATQVLQGRPPSDLQI